MGWARANIFYEKLAAPPESGSLQEALCILVQKYKQEQDFYKTLSELHPEGSKERQDAFDSFRHALFPYIEHVAKNEESRTQSILERAFRFGPIRVVPIEEERPRRKKDE